MNTLLLSVYLLIFINHASVSYVWKDHNLQNPRTEQRLLRAKHGFGHQSNLIRPGFQVFPIRDDKVHMSRPIPPNFIIGARLESDNPIFTERILTKPKRWAISKIYEPPLEDAYGAEDGSIGTMNEIYDDEDETDDTMDDEDEIYDDDSDVNEMGPVVEPYPDPYPNINYLQEMNKVPDDQSTKLIFEGRSEPKPSSPVDPRLNHPYSPQYTKYPYMNPYIDVNPHNMEESEKFEPIHQIRRSSSGWLSRDTQRLGEPRQSLCTLPLNRGVGPDELSSWYYETSENRCRWFGYRGFGGNANRFYSRSACEAYCIKDLENLCSVVTCSWPGASCELVEDHICKQNENRYGRDWRSKCPPDQPVCMSRRGTKMAPDLEFKQIPSDCMQPKDNGSCMRKNPSLNFYYDPTQHTCMTFYFNNCGGNDNRFETKSDCMTHCAP